MNFSPSNPGDSLAQPQMILPYAGTLTVPDEVLERNRIVGFDSHDEQARPFNLLRAQILRKVEDDQQRLLGITSPTPAAGKTFLSVNLGAALSRIANRAVVLCDLDLRRGSVLKSFEGDVDIDLSCYLRGETVDWGDALYRVNDSDLYIVPCKARSRGSDQLLSSHVFEQFIASLRMLPPEVIVLCDLPPVFASDDALLAAKHLDAYLMVVEYGHNTAAQVKEAARLLDPLECLGSVLNRYKSGFLDTYGYGYDDRYGQYYGTAE